MQAGTQQAQAARTLQDLIRDIDSYEKKCRGLSSSCQRDFERFHGKMERLSKK
jgi:hypothetical protein